MLIPRSELDRRETAAFTAGWAEAMAEELPRIRREYEKRVAEAYAAGSGRGSDPAARSTPGEGRGATVIRLPFATLLEPSPLVRETEERMRRAQEILGLRPDDTGHEHAAEADAGADAERAQPHRDGDEETAEYGGTESESEGDSESDTAPAETGPAADDPAAPPAPASRASGKRAAPAGRKVVRRNGRPIVPPLNSVPVQPRTHGAPADTPADGPGAAGDTGRPSLAAKARALARDMESRGRPDEPRDGG
ncbi:hypothetical protein [Streptomyces sp. NPDC003952]